MPTYLYCLRTDRADPPDGLTGVDGAMVHAVGTPELMAWVSDVADGVTPTVDRVRAHDAVCAAALAGEETPLPFRFGQTFRDDGAVVAELAARASVLRPRLARIAGCVELRLVMPRDSVSASEQTPIAGARPPDAPSAESDASREADGPGTAFLKRLARHRRADLTLVVGCEEVRDAVCAAAASLIVGQQPCESARGISFFPVLVRRTEVDSFRSALDETLRTKVIPLSVLGPFAPYSFADDA